MKIIYKNVINFSYVIFRKIYYKRILQKQLANCLSGGYQIRLQCESAE